MFLYEFDTLGIIYTIATAVPIVLLVIATIVFCVRVKAGGGATVLFRVLDILLLVVLLAVWAVYVLTRLSVAGLSIVASENGADIVLNDSVLFTLPGCASLPDISGSILGTVLLGVLTFFAILALVLSVTRRRGKKDVTSSPAADEVSVPDGSVSAVPAPSLTAPVRETTEDASPLRETSVPSDAPAEEHPAEGLPSEVAPAPCEEETDISLTADERSAPAEPAEDENVVAETGQPEPAEEESVAAETEPSEPAEAENIAAEIEQSAPAEEENVVADAEEASPAADEGSVAAAGQEKAGNADIAKDMPASSAERPKHAPKAPVISDDEHVSIMDYSDRARGTSGKRYASALQMPGAKSGERRAVSRPVAERAEREAARGAGTGSPRPLPITRKLVITNRMNVVNMYNEYLKERRKQEKGNISETSAGTDEEK